MSRSQKQGNSSPEALFDAYGDTGEGDPIAQRSGGTEVLGGLVDEEAAIIVETGRHAGERISLGAGTCVIGRSSKCALVLRRSAGVSRRHAKIRYAGGNYEVSDCGSRNGTRVNGNKVGVGYLLNDGDVIQISDERIRYRGPSGRDADSERRGLLGEMQPVDQQAPRNGVHQPTQRVRVDSPDSLLMTQDGGTAPDRPVPPPRPAKANPSIPSRGDAMPAAPTALFTSQLEALPQRPAVVVPATAMSSSAQREPPKTLLFVLGVVLGIAVLAGGVTTWDVLANEGRVLAALFEDVRLLRAGVDAALRDSPAAPKEPAVLEERAEPLGAGGGEALPSPPIASATAKEPEPKTEAAADPPAAASPEPTAEEEPEVAPREERARPASSGGQISAPGGIFEVKAPMEGRVRSLTVGAGSVVRQGDVLFVVERASARVTRKLVALRREEAQFKKHAELGNPRAKRDLDEVRREIARLERRAGLVEVKAEVGGRVEGLLVDNNRAVKAGAVVVRIAVGG